MFESGPEIGTDDHHRIAGAQDSAFEAAVPGTYGGGERKAFLAKASGDAGTVDILQPEDKFGADLRRTAD